MLSIRTRKNPYVLHIYKYLKPGDLWPGHGRCPAPRIQKKILKLLLFPVKKSNMNIIKFLVTQLLNTHDIPGFALKLPVDAMFSQPFVEKIYL